MPSLAALVSLVIFTSVCVDNVTSHGRLWEPPSRSSMWRRKFRTPINYQDNELFCGGFKHQVDQGYKCGVCGDPYDGMRQNEAGGKYATGIIGRTYTQGQRVTIEVDLTANHKGYFEFKLCPVKDKDERATLECMDRHRIPLADGSGYRFPIDFAGPGKVLIDVVLPADLTCKQCVMQWRYHAGNSWGNDPDGNGCLGCGLQEEFYGCADVAILPKGSSSNGVTTTTKPHITTTTARTEPPTTKPHISTTTARTEPPTTKPTRRPITTSTRRRTTTVRTNPSSTTTTAAPTTAAPTTAAPTTAAPTTRSTTDTPTTTASSQTNGEGKGAGHYVTRLDCIALDSAAGMKKWCDQNCVSGFCPTNLCKCSKTRVFLLDATHDLNICRAVPAYAARPGLNTWCANNCARGNCPSGVCEC